MSGQSQITETTNFLSSKRSSGSGVKVAIGQRDRIRIWIKFELWGQEEVRLGDKHPPTKTGTFSIQNLQGQGSIAGHTKKQTPTQKTTHAYPSTQVAPPHIHHYTNPYLSAILASTNTHPLTHITQSYRDEPTRLHERNNPPTYTHMPDICNNALTRL